MTDRRSTVVEVGNLVEYNVHDLGWVQAVVPFLTRRGLRAAVTVRPVRTSLRDLCLPSDQVTVVQRRAYAAA
jgi:hypothetical protein